MNDFTHRIAQAKKVIEGAEYILLGGGAGLSAAAGIEYGGERFRRNFAPFIERYGLTDMYTSGFYPFRTQEERWAYWAKHISLNRYEVGTTELYLSLKQLVQGKKHFVITTNVDSQFEKAGFPPDKIFEVQGNYGYLQCAKGYHDRVYGNEGLVKEMINKTVDCKIPTELVPKCPVCGENMDPHLRINQYFVQDEKWYRLNEAYNKFLQESDGKRIVYLELGVGFNTPAIMRYPFERLTYHNINATLVRFNKDNPEGFVENKDKTIAFSENMHEVVSAIIS
ncbi:Sir2 family NAD-dependent protein deacetylase [Paenibacillus kribbensis]|uniref:Sir2 family NAD-dependent protein deacetylase n=1 Tax=Paenibacillus kribbensis TaxID=172713 RepID=UPI0008390506|nr:Sir2 family NAD-dependent protein deacetylase [Paenibacillus kribbensis]